MSTFMQVRNKLRRKISVADSVYLPNTQSKAEQYFFSLTSLFPDCYG